MTLLHDFRPEAGFAAALQARVSATPHLPAATRWDGRAWVCDDWTRLQSRVEALAQNFRDAGAGPGDAICVFLKTSYAWALVDYAIQTIGAVSVVFHPGWSAADVAAALSIVRPMLTVCGTDEAMIIRPLLADVATASILWVHDGEYADDPLWRRTAAAAGPLLAPRPTVCAAALGETATVVFTSGTSGRIKAATLTQRSMLAAAQHAYAQLGFDGRRATTLHWLPFSHMFGRIGLYLDLLAGGNSHFSRGLEHFAEDLQHAAPTVLFAVPIALTRLRHRFARALAEQTRWRRRIIRIALTAGGWAAAAPTVVRGPVQHFLRTRIFRDFHDALGGGLGLIVVGGAPVDRTDKQFFEALGIAIREGYGLTESSGVAALQSLRRPLAGAGALLPGLEAKIGRDGELLLRGDLMLGRYLNDDAYDGAGWFHTGDRCRIDPDGALTITGRIKDMIIPATGENIDPVKIEALLMRNPLIAEACIVGDGRPCLIAMIVPNAGIGATPQRDRPRDPVPDPAPIRRHVDAVNAALSSFEQIRGFILVDGFSQDAGELTITSKKRRARIQSNRSGAIDQFYEALRLDRASSRHVEPA